MIDNIINQIKESESKAKDLIVLSKRESAEIIEKAYQKANEILKEAEKEAKEMYMEAETNAKNDVGKEAIKLEKDFNRKLEEIKNISKSREEKAIEQIVQRIID